MRKRSFLLAAVALLVAGVAIVIPRWRNSAASPSEEATPASGTRSPVGPDPVDRSLIGRVLDRTGRAVDGAQVSVAATQPNLATRTCPVCLKPLLSCLTRPTFGRVLESLNSGSDAIAPAASVLSDRDGRFRFDHLSGASFTVWAAKHDYGLGVIERARPGQPIDVILAATRFLRGHVQDADGRALEGVQVRAISLRLPLPVSTVSRVDGTFHLEVAGEGPFYVIAAKDGWLPAVEPSANADSDELALTLESPRVLEVSVHEAGSPVDAVVRVRGDHLERELHAERGMARFEGLAPDEVDVVASLGSRAAGPQTITLTHSTTRLDLELEPGGVISLTVIDEAGQPVPEPRIITSATQGFEAALDDRHARTGERVTIGPLPFGEYWISTTAEGFQDSERPVEVKAARTEIDWTLDRATMISGRVIDELGRGVPDVSLMVSPLRDVATSGPDGKFSFGVPSPGLYTLEAHHSDWGGGSLKATAPASGLEVHLSPRASIGVLVTSGGRAVEGAEASVSSDTLGFYRSDRPSGSDGRVLLKGVQAGTYVLSIDHPKFLTAPTQTVTLKDGELAQVSIELRAGTALSGSVVDDRGGPVVGASVHATYLPASATTFDASTPEEPRDAQATSDALGRFELKPLLPDARVDLEVQHARYEDSRVNGVPSDGNGLQIVLKQKPLVRGRVIDSLGAPVKRFDVDGQSVTATDGRFELYLGGNDGTLSFSVSSIGFELKEVEVPFTVDVGDLVLKPSPRVSGVVQDDHGAPVQDAVVTCSVCDSSVSTGPGGDFRLPVREFESDSVSVSATKGKSVASAQVSMPPAESLVLTLRSAVHVTGSVYEADGTPAAGRGISAFDSVRSETVSWVTAADGTYQVDLPAGRYQIPEDWAASPSSQTFLVATVQGTQMKMDLGPAPGSQMLTVTLSPELSSFWIIPGDVGPATEEELLTVPLANVVYASQLDTVQVRGLAAGSYTVAWSPTAETTSRTQVKHVDIRGPTQVSLNP